MSLLTEAFCRKGCMYLKIFTIPFDAEYSGFDDRELAEFSRQVQVLSIQSHLVQHQQQPHWTALVSYRPKGPASAFQALSRKNKTPAKAPEPPEHVSADDDLKLKTYEKLRLWRNQIAREKGQKPSLVFSNRELRAIVDLNPTTLAQLSTVYGIGTWKIDNFGKQVLAILSKTLALNITNASESLALTETPSQDDSAPPSSEENSHA